jgi:hypothetical protein
LTPLLHVKSHPGLHVAAPFGGVLHGELHILPQLFCGDAIWHVVPQSSVPLGQAQCPL